MTNLFVLVALTSFMYKYLLADIAGWKWIKKVRLWVAVTDVIFIMWLWLTEEVQTAGRIIIATCQCYEKVPMGENTTVWNVLGIFIIWASGSFKGGWVV